MYPSQAHSLEAHLEPVANLTLEFDFRAIADGSSAAVRYANNSNYRNDSLIRKESRWKWKYGTGLGVISH